MKNLAVLLVFTLVSLPSVISFIHLDYGQNQRQHHVMHSTTMPTAIVGPRVPINEEFPGLKKIYSNPDIFVIENFLDDSYCQDLIDKASAKKLERSPVAYAGWTEDFKDLVELSSKGPIAWIALLSSYFQVKDSGGGQVDLVVHALQNYAIVFVVATMLIGGFTYSRAEGLKSLRTSTSTTLDDVSDPSYGAREFVRQAAKLFHSDGQFDSTSFMQEATLFEAPTVIRYEPDQILAPHYDANRSAETEDANRGGQTLATLLVYLNDVERGGLTRFGMLSSSAAIEHTDEDSMNSDGDDKLVIQPKRGDALLFFPADRNGQFDPRTEHEGMPAVDEKWIARIWKHTRRVPAPFGLSESSLCDID
uniref:Fe2OG dioxygenase domain-containing protein n=1 Tax=Pseudo-nitzschia australis TaxID=44445 RepID=A0A7S4EPA0_9STRA|mmetsp:Transcript_7270/g.15560  ORF Transcript_7270/g.15560 Transcript_7270/m.15560 type:complete len:363 (-) Transcript_7270:48-1136(-)|eukprot:CAMPEP_0168167070 /NCGR_PEP_ID=MMETSP0139_2-20121125/2360_1 /TAXON_ID=44445 /ORGANISM="Pseudo-nitzschia australis, Strain 10249 10 AB" /LENGTH=362 /DNA_ID=CAMNT_0008084301 /DNA_START=124 /DNA_END=1212 /DNA_ORIENTATION=+